MFLRSIVAVSVLVLFGAVPPSRAADKAAALQLGPTKIVTFSAGVPVSERRRVVEAAGAIVVRELPFIDGLLIKMAGLQPKAIQLVSAAPGVEALEDNAYRKWISVEMDTLPSVKDILDSARAGKTPAPEVGAAAGEIPWGVARVKAPEAWSRTMGAGVKVAVIDTGIDCTHSDLASNCAGGFNALDEAKDPSDDHGHGTHVAGSIAAKKDGKGVVGVAPKAKLYAIKVLDGEGGGTMEGIVNGIAWAVENKMQVINMSLGGPSSAAMKKAVEKAYAAGVTIVAAAGNDPEAPVSAPAQYKQSIAVSASTIDDKLAFFSTTGPEIAVIAPGHDIVSCKMGGGTAKMSGTSMASPHVAGLAALAVSLGASTPKAVRAMLTSAAVPIEGLTQNQQGSGLVQADKMGK
ncbi:MAG TPA: hypothetical protein DCM05_07725 [Elusimicrobia bacterium]|nr:hypothetical protein [Elusimicrobiota bacterium]